MKADMNPVSLGTVQETLLLPLWGRAVESRKPQPLLVDPVAVSVVEGLPYDFDRLARNLSPITRAAWIARSIWFDGKIGEFLGRHPAGTVVNIGCGLDTTYDRVHNGMATWYELDLPDVIELRRQYIKEGDRRVFVAGSVLDDEWTSRVGEAEHVFLLMAGVVYYFEEKQLRRLFDRLCERFPGATLCFDYDSWRGVRIANKQVIAKGGMSAGANLVWGSDNIREIEGWNPRLKVVESMPVFREHRKRYPLSRRLGMAISDALKVMSLAKVEIDRE